MRDGQPGIPVVTDGEVHEEGVVESGGEVAVDRAGRVLGHRVAGRVGVDRVRQVVQLRDDESGVGVGTQGAVIVVPLLDEGRGVDSETVIEETVVPSDAALVGHVHDMVLGLAVAG